jgi:hypothetical protein
LRVTFSPFVVRETSSWCTSETVPSAHEEPHFHFTVVPVRIAMPRPYAASALSLLTSRLVLMTEDELVDLMTSIEEGVPLPDKAAAFEVEARRLAVGEHGRAQLLACAGEHWQMRGEYDEARRCYGEARADDGDTMIDVWAHLLSLALDEGDEDQVRAMDRSLRVAVSVDALEPDNCLFVGESYEHHGRLKEALRWFTMPLTWGEEDDLDEVCLRARWRVRRDLGLPVDRLDSLATPPGAG